MTRPLSTAVNASYEAGDLADLTDFELVARENALRQQVGRGLDNGCREYLVAVVCEQGKRAIADCRAIIASMIPAAQAAPIQTREAA